MPGMAIPIPCRRSGSGQRRSIMHRSFQMATPSQFELANRLLGIAPEGFGQVFTAISGSRR